MHIGPFLVSISVRRRHSSLPLVVDTRCVHKNDEFVDTMECKTVTSTVAKKIELIETLRSVSPFLSSLEQP